MPLAPGSRYGAYEVLSRIGAGGMGEVYRARDPRLDREVALKVLPAETLSDDRARARLLREARLASKLNHPNICTIYEVGEEAGQAYIAMELVSGETLSEHIARGRIGTVEVLRLAQQIADALAHAHSKGIVHRDFKSGNVMITPERRAKVLDFGLASRLSNGELSEATTYSVDSLELSGKIVGTLAYMAPEQLRGEAADARSDIWALGVVLYEMASGVRPFHGKSGFELSSAILNGTPDPLPPGRASNTPTQLQPVIDRCLEKEPERRYQSAAEVRAVLESALSGTKVTLRPNRRWLWIAAGLAGVLVALALLVSGGMSRLLPKGFSSQVGPVRMAVLPFVNLSGDPEQEYLADGLTQEMIAQLGRLQPETLSVIARTSVMRYKHTETPIDQIGRDLKVAYVLEGSTQREGSQVRITAELIRVEDQSQLWADSFEREMAGILALESDVARKVADSLALKLLPAEKARLAGARTVDPEAYDAYLKGSQYWIKMTRGDLDTAEGYFNVALEKDPDFAPAHAGMAWVWMVRNQMGYAPPNEAVPKEREAALRAVALDDTLAEAHYALAGVRTFSEWDIPGAGPEWRRAIELDPNDPNGVAMYSHYLAITGHMDEAMEQVDRAVSLDPFNVTVHTFRAMGLVFARRWDEALGEANRALAMEPGQPGAQQAQGFLLVESGRYEQALPVIREFYKQIYRLPDLDAVMARGFSEAGFQGAMRRAADALTGLAARGDALPTDVANLYLWAGDTSQALDWLEKGYEMRDPGMPYVGVFPMYDSLRCEPRFQALLRKMGLPSTLQPATPSAAGASS